MTTFIDQPAVPPHDPEIERAILGAILLYPAVMTTVGELISEADFYVLANRRTYCAMFSPRQRGEHH